MRLSPFVLRGVLVAKLSNVDHPTWHLSWATTFFCDKVDHGTVPTIAAPWGAVCSEPAAEDLFILAHLER